MHDKGLNKDARLPLPRRSGATLGALLAAAGLLAGCVSYDGINPKAHMGNPADLAAANALANAKVADGQWPAADWWKRFGDPQLNALVDEALASSPSLRESLARVDSAVAAATIAGAPLGIGVTAGFDNSRQLLSKYGLVPAGFGGTWITSNQLALFVSYQTDFWGQNQAGLDAALGQARASEAEAQAARLALASAVTQVYLELSYNYAQMDLAQQMLQQQESMLDLARQRLANGLDSLINLRQAEATLPQQRVRLVQYQRVVDQGRNQLAALLGKGPDRGKAITRPQLGPDALASVALPSRLPADLIGRRPDIIAARWRVEAAQRGVHSAKAAFYPNINLNMAGGLQSLVLSKFLTPGAEFLSFGPAIRLPLFGSGTLKGTLGERDAELDIAIERYNQLLADALRDVANQVDALRSTDQQETELNQALGIAQDGYKLAQAREAGGLAPRLSVLLAQDEVLARRSAIVDLQAARLAINLNLIRALGGGLEDDKAGTAPAEAEAAAEKAAPKSLR